MNLIGSFSEKGIKVYHLAPKGKNGIPNNCFLVKQDFFDFACINEVREVFYYDYESENEVDTLHYWYETWRIINTNYSFLQIVDSDDLEYSLSEKFEEYIDSLIEKLGKKKSVVYFFMTDLGMYGFVDGDEVQNLKLDAGLNIWRVSNDFIANERLAIQQVGNKAIMKANSQFSEMCSMLTKDEMFSNMKSHSKRILYAKQFADKHNFQDMYRIFTNITKFTKCQELVYDKKKREAMIDEAWIQCGNQDE